MGKAAKLSKEMRLAYAKVLALSLAPTPVERCYQLIRRLYDVERGFRQGRIEPPRVLPLEQPRKRLTWVPVPPEPNQIPAFRVVQLEVLGPDV